MDAGEATSPRSPGAEVSLLNGDSNDLALSDANGHNLASSFPIHRLPPELLIEIFIKASSFNPYSKIDSTLWELLSRPFPFWIALTRVCRKWRRLSLDCSVLWCRIPLHLSARWAEVHFERSNISPLDVEIRIESWLSRDSAFAALAANLHRTKKLYLRGAADSNIVAPVLHRLQVPSPLLESFFVEGIPNEMILSNELFGGAAPRLRSLRLSSGFLPTSSLPLLKTLRDFDYSCTSSIGAVIAILKEIPNLETLTLRHSWHDPTDNHDNAETTPTLDLPFLTKFKLDARFPEDVTSFLSRSSLSPNTRLQVSVGALGHGGDVPRDAMWFEALAQLANHLRKAQKVQGSFTDLAFDAREGFATILGWSRTQLPDPDSLNGGAWYNSEFPSHDKSAPFAFEFAHCGEAGLVGPFFDMQNIFGMLKTTDVQTLWLSINYCLVKRHDVDLQNFLNQAGNPLNWTPILSLFPEVQVLKISGDAVRGVLEALTPVRDLPDESQRDEAGSILCPKLRKLVIMDARIRLHDDETIYSELYHALKRRCAFNAGIEELWLQRCRHTEVETSALARFTNVWLWGKWSRYGTFQGYENIGEGNIHPESEEDVEGTAES